MLYIGKGDTESFQIFILILEGIISGNSEDIKITRIEKWLVGVIWIEFFVNTKSLKCV